ncbi:hypothetical protein [Streptomyces sp. NPDC006879]|uniref:hypothetical protein n=1 Tax=Streptomyces sp. NPDC006879 TaxID=3364767 RepID=UPI00368B0233
MVAQRQRLRGRASLVAVAVIGLVAGCGAGPHEANDDGGAAVRSAADVLVKAGSARTRTSMEMATGGTLVTIRGEGGVDFRSRMGQLLVMLPADAAGKTAHRPITELLVPGALYMKNRGAGVPADKWVKVDTTALEDGNLVTGGATDPVAAAELLRGAQQVTYVGETEVDGARVRHYRGTTDITRAARKASPDARGALQAAAKGFHKDTVPFDAYLDEVGRLRKVRHRFSFVNNGVIDVASTTLLYGFGTPVRVQLPASRDIFAGKIAD